MMDDGLQPLSAPTIARQNTVIKPFAKNSSATKNSVAPKAPCHDDKLYTTTTKRQIRGPTHITALNTLALLSTLWANSKKLERL